MSDKVFTPEGFAMEVEERVHSGREPSYISATADLITEMDCDAEDVKHLLSPTLVAKIENEARSLGLLKAKNTTYSIHSILSTK